MKKVLMLSLAIMMVAGAAMADHIGIYGDAAGTSCYGAIGAGVPASAYVVHTSPGGATASQFKVQDSTGLLNIGATLGSPAYLAIGAWNTGVSVAYTSCLQGTFVVYQLSFLALTAPATCLGLDIVPDPSEQNGIVKIADCGFIELPATSDGFRFNGNETDCPVCQPNATEQSTWGKVKSLYR